MRKTTKTILVRGKSYRVAVEPVEGSIWADVSVDGTKVGHVQQFADKSGYVFVSDLGGAQRRYSHEMLRDVLHNEAWRVDEAARFAADVEAYDGPLDVTFATTACVDCGEQVLASTPELARGHAPYTDCPANEGSMYPGHRVSSGAYRDWQHQKRVIEVVKAARGICTAVCVSNQRREASVCGVTGPHRTHVSLDGLTTWSDPITQGA